MIAFEPGTSGRLQEKFAPLSVAVWLLQVNVLIPERLSDSEPVTVTLAVLIVAPLTGEITLSVGAVLSRLIETVFEAMLLDPSFAFA